MSTEKATDPASTHVQPAPAAQNAPAESACAAEVEPAPSCPTPMAWQGVLKGFREQAESFQFKTSDSLDVSGRVLGEGPPLYILNGLSATSELFCLTTWLLREHFRCVIIDYPEKATSLSQLTSSLFTVADGFGDDQFDLYAASFSTAVALEALSTDAGRIRRAVLQGAVNGVRLSFLERLATKVATILPGRMKHVPFFKAALQNNHRRWFPPIDPSRWYFLALNVGSVPLRTVARRLRMLDRRDWGQRLAGIVTPVFVISSEGESARNRDAADSFAEGIPNAKSEQIPNSGHIPFVTHPHRLVKIVKSFCLDE